MLTEILQPPPMSIPLEEVAAEVMDAMAAVVVVVMSIVMSIVKAICCIKCEVCPEIIYLGKSIS